MSVNCYGCEFHLIILTYELPRYTPIQNIKHIHSIQHSRTVWSELLLKLMLKILFSIKWIYYFFPIFEPVKKFHLGAFDKASA